MVAAITEVVWKKLFTIIVLNSAHSCKTLQQMWVFNSSLESGIEFFGPTIVVQLSHQYLLFVICESFWQTNCSHQIIADSALCLLIRWAIIVTVYICIYRRETCKAESKDRLGTAVERPRIVFVFVVVFSFVFVFLFVSVKLVRHGQRISSSSLGHRRKCGRPLFSQAANPDENCRVWNIGQIAFENMITFANVIHFDLIWLKANVLPALDSWADLNRFEDIWSLIIDLSHLTFVSFDLFISDI